MDDAHLQRMLAEHRRRTGRGTADDRLAPRPPGGTRQPSKDEIAS